MAGPLVIIGDALLDRDVDGDASRLCPDAPAPVLEESTVRSRPGGAALAALLAAAAAERADDEVILIAPFGTDAASAAVLDLLPAGVTTVRLPLAGALQVKTRLRASGQVMLRVDRPAGVPGPADGAAGAAAADAIAAAGALLVSDYGHGTTADPLLRAALGRHARHTPLVWDPHPRGAAPVPGTLVATPNLTEAAGLSGLGDAGNQPGQSGTRERRRDGSAAVLRAAAAAELLLGTWPARSVAVTLGGQGALLARAGQAPLAIPAAAVAASDACGAGDRFAAAVAAGLRDGAILPDAVTQAVTAASLFLADGGVASLGPAPAPLAEQAGAAGAVRAAGGVVVAAGGCFDVLHAGHVSMLRAARALGDCLVVCLNSDDSVRRLKGPGRPFNSAADRAAVLTALGCVDEVTVFDEDTPERVLADIRPAIWVKGGDYDGRELPEAGQLRRWGGRVVTVPYLAGRSTTRIATAAAWL